MTKKITPYEQGRFAFEEDLVIEQNPYPVGSDSFLRWIDGYLDADIVESGQEVE
jgi:hypothetical protein